jgi:hypothetical protein
MVLLKKRRQFLPKGSDLRIFQNSNAREITVLVIKRHLLIAQPISLRVFERRLSEKSAERLVVLREV